MVQIDSMKFKKMLADKSLSQASFAVLSGVSRATIANLFRGKSKSVHAKTAKKLSLALTLDMSELQTSGTENAYLQRICEEYCDLDQSGLGIINPRKPVPIDQGFAPIIVNKIQIDKNNCNKVGRNGTLHTHPDFSHNRLPEKHKDVPFEKAIEFSPRFFLTGEPGSGKTTTLRHFAWKLASAQNSETQARTIPIVVRLAQWGEQLRDDRDFDLVHAAIAQLKIDERTAKSTAEWLCQMIEANNTLLLLDGLDEVADPDTRSLVIEKIRSFFQQHPQTHAIVTSRPVGFEKPNLSSSFEVYAIQRLKIEAIKEFVIQWCANRHGHPSSKQCKGCDEDVERLRHAIVDHPRIGTLAANPMMLTILCLLHDAGAALPQRRFQLYGKIVEAFLFTWEQKKRSAVLGAPDRKLTLDDREICWLLESVALDMQKEDWTLVPRWWLVENISQFLQRELSCGQDEARSQTDALLWSLHERSGLLVERGPDLFGFQHLAFQEYFAARAVLAKPDSIETLRDYLYHPRWREVVRMVAADLDRHLAPQLIKSILDDPDPTGRFLHRGLLLALGCLADGAPCHLTILLDQLKQSVAELGKNIWLGIAFEAMDHLSELRGTRLQPFSKETTKLLLENAKQNSNEDARELFVKHAEKLKFIESESKPEPKIELPEKYDKEWMFTILSNLEELLDDENLIPHTLTMVSFVLNSKQARSDLLHFIKQENNSTIRILIVHLLSFALKEKDVRKYLVSLLADHEEVDPVRTACMDVLKDVAAGDNDVRQELIRYLDADYSPDVREAAISALKPSLSVEPNLSNKIYALLTDNTIDESLRLACLHTLDSELPSISDGLETLNDLLSRGVEDRLCRVSAMILAEYAASGREEWEKLKIETIEQVLVSVKSPCPHFLQALRGLIDTRESRKLSVSLEKRIERLFVEFHDQIEVMFIFGSSASDQQNLDSDIDLMVIGNVTLKDLTPVLKKAEVKLGKQVNVVVYTLEEWKNRLDDGNPFVIRVNKAKKRYVMGERNDFATMGQ